MNNDCLTYEQLQAYASATMERTESARTYKHISNCELCACAVNGFSVIPFSSADIDAIHDRIDRETNATRGNPLTFAQVFIIAVSVFSIFGLYRLVDRIDTTLVKSVPLEKPPVGKINPAIVLHPNLSLNEHSSYKPEKVRNSLVESVRKSNDFFVESLRPISIEKLPLGDQADDQSARPVYSSNVTYIYDLKVSRYNELYFTHLKKVTGLNGDIPASRENRNAPVNMSEPDIQSKTTIDLVLKKGLKYYVDGNYENAIREFALLLENNPDDVNALFYSGVSFCHIGKYPSAIVRLRKVLSNGDPEFNPEAKWNLALALLNTGDRNSAKALFTEINREQGFYAKRAADELKSL